MDEYTKARKYLATFAKEYPLDTFESYLDDDPDADPWDAVEYACAKIGL